MSRSSRRTNRPGRPGRSSATPPGMDAPRLARRPGPPDGRGVPRRPPVKRFVEEGMLDGEPVLPGFRLAVSELLSWTKPFVLPPPGD